MAERDSTSQGGIRTRFPELFLCLPRFPKSSDQLQLYYPKEERSEDFFGVLQDGRMLKGFGILVVVKGSFEVRVGEWMDGRRILRTLKSTWVSRCHQLSQHCF